jgi:uncharacterized membrane protein YhaH (DUF805 family)
LRSVERYDLILNILDNYRLFFDGRIFCVLFSRGQKGVKKMKERNFIAGLLFSLVSVGTVTAMAAPQGSGASGIGPGSFFLSLFSFLVIIGLIVLWIMALVRVIKDMRNSKDTSAPIVTLILLILLAPIGIIFSFTMVIPPVESTARTIPVEPGTDLISRSVTWRLDGFTSCLQA